MPITEYVTGNLLDAEADAIVHGVNCYGAMGAGIAKQIKEQFPQVYSVYKDTVDYYKNSSYLLGMQIAVSVTGKKYKRIINAFTERNYGKDGKRYVNYAALGEIFREIEKKYYNEVIAIPKIGAGLGGGDWNIIKQIIDDATPNVEIKVYEIAPTNK